ncbi:MAG: glycosyltransferase [Actinobacteria bacterium]|uniref:Unannotated protein n=1 Tax=freshwater metagenome TaxID=449393 RepID=A0A6J6U145_9ZZZZ|nr:glycosyltransferase [Actinomycetota bacterium]MSW48080.1 glycosyltransferase [Actinomycetota bacterium]MSX24324.1 glycosyltransferase [Actinomycetota bacterium]MSY46557.1 glycosyltransferase [Actinomycetota bacterium]MSY57498.1 glycosyltransferase [Actinomycetota bacterium]
MAESHDGRIRVMRIIARMNVGGPAVQVSGLMRGIDPLRFNHQLFTGFCGEDESDYLDSVAKDISATRIKGLGRSISLGADIGSFIQIIKEIRSFEPDIIHTHTAKAGVIGRIASLLSGKRSIRVHTFHGHLLHGYFGKVKTQIVITIESVLALFTTRLLAVGKKVMDDLLAEGVGTAAKFSVMSPGLRLGIIPERAAACATLHLDPTKTYCAFIGRITKIKRPDRFLDVVAQLNKDGANVHFLVAGAGELLDYCTERARDESLPVTFLGWCEEVETVLAVSDFLILTSDNEGTPLSLIQAGMAHLPVIATNVGSVSEIVLDGKTGIVTEISTQDLVSAVSKLLGDNELRHKLGDAAYEYTMARYGVERLVRDHQDLYSTLMADRAKS